jgi:hypothetical protein
MSILNHFQHLNLTKDQSIVLEKLDAFIQSEDRVFILKGYAGSGKTTILKGFSEYLNSIEQKFQLMAPTGRAAKVINQKTGFESTTIHKGIYSFSDLKEHQQSDDANDVSFFYEYRISINPKAHETVLIVDEASMVSDIQSQGELFRFGSGRLLSDLVEYSRIKEPATKSKIIFIGDPAQLPPIGMNFSPALNKDYIKEKFGLIASEVELREVKRQSADNGILKAATKIRKCLTSGFFNDFDLRQNNKDIFNPTYQDFLSIYRALENQKIVICYKNKTAAAINREIRIDKFGDNLPIQPSDTIIMGGNNYSLGLMNGEFGVISEASPITESRDISFYNKGGKTETVRLTWRSVTIQRPNEKNEISTVNGLMLENYLHGENDLKPEELRALYIDFKNRHPKFKKGSKEFTDAIRKDLYYNCILLKFGYAVTCHKAQGGEWSNAMIFWDRAEQTKFNSHKSEHDSTGKTNSDFYRWAYTAITRASERLFCIEPPYFNSYSKMNFIDIPVQKAIQNLTGDTIPSIEVDFTDVIPDIQKFGLQDSSLTIQDHFIHRWYHLRKHYIDIENFQVLGYEVRYTFTRQQKKVSMKYWINGQNNFKPNFQKIPALTNSDELFEEVTKLIENGSTLVVNRTAPEGVLAQIEFDVNLEEEKPFLKNLFDSISQELSNDVLIAGIQHLPFRERYSIEKNRKVCVIDFEYDGDGFFGRVLPIEKKCESPELLEKIKFIVNKLKSSDYVI